VTLMNRSNLVILLSFQETKGVSGDEKRYQEESNC
jgi:hypothetical protein